MKPYIMNYSEEHDIKPANFNYCPQKQLNVLLNGKNVVSEYICGHTTFTETVESSDPDELDMLSTVYTKTVEPADPDEILFCDTSWTFTVEPADPDEVVL